MKPKLIVANWKMNPANQKDAKELFDVLKKGISKIKNAEVIICPPFVYLPLVFSGAEEFKLGSQNVFYEEKGAFTGAISVLQLKDLNVKYVILGHPDHRKYFYETDELINKKVRKVLKKGIKPILCVGEQEDQNKEVILEGQITKALKGISEKSVLNVIIAYEPVFAIGTGKNCSVKETLDSVLIIRSVISKLYNKDLAKNIKVIYGGSVNSDNSALYFKENEVNGLLVGGSSLNSEEFIKIVKSA